MSEIKFGTDGWRAVIAEDFTFENVEKVAQATADCWKQIYNGKKLKAVVGYDTRFLSNEFAKSAAAVFAGNGFKCVLTDKPTPTPAISLAVKKIENCAGAVVITASHNPPQFNGFKLKSYYGGPSLDEELIEIEKRIGASRVKKIDFNTALKEKLILIKDIKNPHLKEVSKLVDLRLISKAQLSIAHDALFGVSAGFYREFLKATECDVAELNDKHDPLFGGLRPEPVEENYIFSSKWLKENPRDLCIVNDGDADRIGALDGTGKPLTAHEIVCLLLIHLIKNRKQKGRIVKALTTTSVVDRICSDYGLELVETKVGFKNICREMLTGNVLMGGEESGSVGFGNHIPERDGLLAGAMLLELVAYEGKNIRELVGEIGKKYGRTYYHRIDAHLQKDIAEKIVSKIIKNPPLKIPGKKLRELNALDGAKFVFQDDDWLMFRASGTEPLLRIYSESSSRKTLKDLLYYGLNLVKQLSKTE